jgi:hypothetical protein
MNLQKIAGIVGIVLAVVAVFIAIPYVGAILLIIGLVVGFTIPGDEHVRAIVSALALQALAHTFDAIPQIGNYLTMILVNVGIAVAGAAIMIILRNIYARLKP